MKLTSFREWKTFLCFLVLEKCIQCSYPIDTRPNYLWSSVTVQPLLKDRKRIVFFFLFSKVPELDSRFWRH